MKKKTVKKKTIKKKIKVHARYKGRKPSNKNKNSKVKKLIKLAGLRKKKGKRKK